MTHFIPNPNPSYRYRGLVESEARQEDLRRLAAKVAEDTLAEVLGIRSANLARVFDTTDLLISYVSDALGENYRVRWSEPDGEWQARAQAWEEYCEELFLEVRTFINNQLAQKAYWSDESCEMCSYNHDLTFTPTSKET